MRIAEISFGEGKGRLGLTICPGKKDPVRGWNRDLIEDLSVVQRWGAKAIVTLIEDHEFALLAVPDLGKRVVAMGMDWHHLPIRDVDVPDGRFEGAWPVSGLAIQNCIDAGESVLIHCRGGIGRTGLVAARLLIERGGRPRDAINRVRAVRPGAIETLAQEAYVMNTVFPMPGELGSSNDE